MELKSQDNKLSEHSEIEHQIQEARTEMKKLKDEIYLVAINDPNQQSYIKIAQELGVPADEIKENVARDYATSNDILYLLEEASLAENCFTVARVGSISFEPLDFCLGIVVVGANNVAFGAHIASETRDKEEADYFKHKASDFLGQMSRFFKSNPSKLIFVSLHLGKTVQQKEFITTLTTTYPNAEVERVQGDNL